MEGKDPFTKCQRIEFLQVDDDDNDDDQWTKHSIKKIVSSPPGPQKRNCLNIF